MNYINLLEQYTAAVKRQEIAFDANQSILWSHLAILAETLQKRKKCLFRGFKKNITGLYIHGTVGSGKTYLMDLFFKNVAIKEKKRMHFHQFMQQIDQQLRLHQGKKNPLIVISKELAKTTTLLCLDEFMVNDIAYAMILSGLLHALFSEGIVLVTTSNVHPDTLYWDGLQRQLFLPAIELIKAHCEVVQLSALVDYRLNRVPQWATYLYPLTPDNESQFSRQFLSFVDFPIFQGNLRIQLREIPFVYRGNTAIWFEFNKLCQCPRSQLDYLEIADQFPIVFLSNVPALTKKNEIILFMHLVDVFYDKKIRLIILAQVSIAELHPKGSMRLVFERTVSRLYEMQSTNYWQDK